jgi:hypothetical protein
MRRFMAMRIMHCLAVKLSAVCRWGLAARRETSVVTLTVVETMIDVSVKMIRPMEPWSRTNEYAA